jgi:REP-associated tyrosine transposase
MARLRRLYVPGVPAHIWVRGNNRQAIFRSEGDRVYFHRCLVDVTRRFGVRVHAYVLMTNHVHILGTGERPDSLSRAVQSMGRRYVSYFNYLYERTGTLWEGRFRSCPVESERYFFVCHRYVEMNPVRAEMVGDPGRHQWSSYRCNAIGAKDDLVTPHSLYMDLGATEPERREAYRRLFDVELDAPMLAAIRHSGSKGWALGGKEFCEFLEAQAGRPAARRKAGRPRRTSAPSTQQEIPELT